MAGDMTVDSKYSVTNSSPESPESEIPFIFQCERCRHILGDSTAWSCSDETLRTIVVHSVTNAVIAEEKIEISKDEYDLGCTYLKLLCRFCKTAVGRMYKTTARHLDHLRDLFTFHVDSINSYQFGNLDCTVDHTELVNMPTLKSVNSSLSKIRHVMVCFNTRLTAVEKKTQSENTAIPETNHLDYDDVSTCSFIGKGSKELEEGCEEKTKKQIKNEKQLKTASPTVSPVKQKDGTLSSRVKTKERPVQPDSRSKKVWSVSQIFTDQPSGPQIFMEDSCSTCSHETDGRNSEDDQMVTSQMSHKKNHSSQKRKSFNLDNTFYKRKRKL